MALHVVPVENGTLAEARLGMIPDLLVRIQFGRVGRQEDQPDVPVLP
jgi:hypothetical protein